MSDVWYYEKGGKNVGPVAFEQLKAELLKGPDWSEQFVWRTGAKDWIKAGDVSELAAISPPISPQQATAPPSVAREEPITAPTPIVPEEPPTTPPIVPDGPATTSPIAPEELATTPPFVPDEHATTPLIEPEERASTQSVVPEERATTPLPVAIKESKPQQVLYKKSGVVVTPTLARFDNVTYPISGIGSVRVDRPRRWLAISCAVVLSFFGYLIILGDTKGEATSLVIVLFAVALIFLIWAFGKPYRLVLGTASGDQHAFISVRQQVLEEMKQAIEQAFVRRG